MITIIIPEWAMWMIAVFLLINAATVGADMFVRLRIYKLMLKRKLFW